MQVIFLKWLRKNAHSLSIGTISIWLHSLHVTATPTTDAFSPTQLQTIYRMAENSAKKEDGVFYKEFLQAERFRPENSKLNYVIALYPIEGMQGGNSSEELIALLTEDTTGKLVLLEEKHISHRNYGTFLRFEMALLHNYLIV